MKTTSYRAYISYSHSDERWAVWLHRALESYRVPGKLIGEETERGKVPKHLRPVFRDRDDLSSSSDLNTTVKEALIASENLVVVCSPTAAASHWVNEEIREFVRLGRQSQIFCIIVDGDPASSGADSRCFPHALAECGLNEPLAADVRKWADGKYLGKLKLVAGLLGLPLDQLRRRELQKRRKIQLLRLVVSVVVAALMISAIWFQMSAQQRRSSGESLVAVKLNELRILLNVKEDPEDLQHLGDWDKKSLEDLIVSVGNEDATPIEKAMKLRDLGIEKRKEGAADAALQAFRMSWVLIAESYLVDRSDQLVFFELGQAEYWVGLIHFDQGELEQAEHFFMSYAEITRRLILLQPENDEWVLEMSYALTNLGSVQRARGFNNPVRALQLMQSALEYNQLALVLDPSSSYYRSELGQSNANLADAQRDVCDLEGALESQQENIRVQSELFQADNSSTSRMVRLAFALSGKALIQQMMGNLEEAKPGLERSLQLLEDLLVQKPDSQSRQRQVLERKQRLAWLDAMSGNSEKAWEASKAIYEDWQVFLQENGTEELLNMQAYSIYILNRAWLANDRGDVELALQIVTESLVLLEGMLIKLPNNRALGNLLTQAVFQYWLIQQQLPASGTWDLLPDYAADNGRTRACADAGMAVRKAIMEGDLATAQGLTTYLLDHGYREASFIQVCTAHSLCPGQ